MLDISFDPAACLPACLCTCRYGDLFKSNLLGALCIIPTKPEMIKWVLKQEGRLFITGYHKSFKKVFGELAALNAVGDLWKSARRFINNSLRAELLQA
jgi:hypothetical protein